MCAGPVQYRITEREHQILQSAATCAADLDPNYCFAGRLATPHVCSISMACITSAVAGLSMVSCRHHYTTFALRLPGMRIIPCMVHTHACKRLDPLCISGVAQALRWQRRQAAGQLWR